MNYRLIFFLICLTSSALAESFSCQYYEILGAEDYLCSHLYRGRSDSVTPPTNSEQNQIAPKEQLKLQTMLDDAESLSDNRAYSKAEQLYRKIIHERRDYAPVWIKMAHFYSRLNREHDALHTLERGLQEVSENADIYHEMGLFQVRLGLLSKALSSLAWAAIKAPENAHYSYVYAIALHSTHRSSKAIDILLQAHQRHAENLEILMALFLINRELGYASDALLAAHKILLIDSDNEYARSYVLKSENQKITTKGIKMSEAAKVSEVAKEPVDVVEQVSKLMDPEASSMLLDSALELLMIYGPKVLAAIAIFFIGKIVAKWLKRIVIKVMTKSNVDPLIIGFTSSIVYMAMMVFVVVATLGQIGIQTTSFIAILGAAGLAIGLALQGSLANFAAGFLLIIFRPFKEGDVIEAAGVTGKVDIIQIFTTTLKTPDNKTIIVPNAKLGGDNIINYSAQKTRRVDITVGVSYDADLKEVRHILEDIVNKDERILKEPEHQIVVGELADNSVNFFVRVWVESGEYWNVYFDTNETVKIRLDAAGIGIPYPQRDVHLYEHKAD